MQARFYVYLGVAAFFAFSLGLNIGLLGFHNFHFEVAQGPLSLRSFTHSDTSAHPSLSVTSGVEKHNRLAIYRRESPVVPGDVITADEVAVHRDTSALVRDSEEVKESITRKYSEDKAAVLNSKSLFTHPEPLHIPPTTITTTTTATATDSNPSAVTHTLTHPYASMGNGPIATFLQKGGEIPIVLITCNRVDLLEATIQNLLKVHHITKDIVVVQDGTMKAIADTATSHGLQVIQNKETNRRLRGSDGASRIATHYKFALTTIFDLRPDAPAAIIIEDDLLFSPDFYEYFLHTAAIIEQDKSVFAVSAWNDNGFKGRVQDPFALRRTEFFPGLGWLLSRELYKSELEKKWPQNHWDHWLRAPETHKGREIVYPEVPRTYHNGIKGTFMNLDTHNQYFRDIAYNQDPSISWKETSLTTPLYESAKQPNYEKRVTNLINSCHHVTDVQDFVKNKAGVYCIWIREDPDPRFGTPPFQPIAKVFGIWHEHKRGVHRGMHEFYWNPSKDDQREKSYILVLNTIGGDKSYQSLKPASVPLMSPQHFKALLPHLRGG